MPRAATSDDLTLLRSDGQACKLYAAFFVPHTIYTAQLASVPSTTDQVAEIAFTAGSGTLANVKPDMLLKVGSTSGGQELGIARIRKAPIAGTFYIGEQSIINWSAASPVYLTVVDDYDLHAKHVRINGTTILMDYDIAFSDQHTVFSPVPVLGPVVSVVELNEGVGAVQVGPESGYHSWVIGSTISSHLWTSPSSGVFFSDSSEESPTLTITSPGWKLIYDLVTAANGKTRQGMRYVYAYDKDNPPLSVLTLGDNAEDSKQGGSNFTLVFSNGAPLSTIPDRALCVLFAKDYYGIGDDQQQVSLGAVEGRENVLFTGRVISESLSYDEETQTASLEIQGYQELMKRIHGFPAGLRFKVTPETWIDMPSMTVDRALYHLLEYHTTAITIMDFNRTGDTHLTAKSFSPFSNIWEQMREYAEKQILANTRVDHLGRLFFEIDPQLLPVASRTYPVVMTLTDADLTGRVELPREVLSEVGQINLSGVAVDSGGNAAAFFSLSPGHIHDRTGRVEIADRLLLADQTQANALAGLLFGAKNNPYKPMRLKLRANNRLVTCFPNQAIAYTISAANNARGFAIAKHWIPRQRKLSYDPETGQLSVELVVEAESTPMHAIKGDVPGSGDFTFPPLDGLPNLPNIPVILPGGFPPSSDNGPKSVIVHSPDFGLAMTNNFDDDSPDWFLINGGLTTAQYQQVNQIIVTPAGRVYAISIRPYNAGTGQYPFVARADYAGGLFTIIEDHNTIASRLSLGSPTNVRISHAGYNPLASDQVMWTVGVFASVCKNVLCTDGTPVTKISIDQNATGGSISYGAGAWLITGQRMSGAMAALKMSADGGTVVSNNLIPSPGITRSIHVRISTTGDTYHWPGTVPDDYLVKGEDNGASFVSPIGDGIPTGRPLAISPNGLYMMTVRGASGRGKSADGGYSWTDVSSLPAVGPNWSFAWAGGTGLSDSRWIAVYSYVAYSDDFGATWDLGKQGNLPSIDPLFILDIVTVLEF